jgi:hypothetical protein
MGGRNLPLKCHECDWSLDRVCATLVVYFALNREARMTGILDRFHVEHGVHGAKVMARSLQLTGNCEDEAEIDTAIQMLKDDLDACGKEMKRLVKVNRVSEFEGWPNG